MAEIEGLLVDDTRLLTLTGSGGCGKTRLALAVAADLVESHRTPRATLGWSYDLLSEPERLLFGRLSVFAGGWTLEAAEAMGEGEGIEEEDVLDLLSKLLDKSLVVVEEVGGA